MKTSPWLAAAFLLVAIPVSLAAQQQPPHALQAQTDVWGRTSFTNGATGERWGSVGLLRGDVYRLPLSTRAAREFRSIQRNRTLGTALVGLGAAITLGAITHYVAEPNGFGMSGAQTAAMAGGMGITILGTQRAWSSHKSLMLAVDSYNRGLAACTPAASASPPERTLGSC